MKYILQCHVIIVLSTEIATFVGDLGSVGTASLLIGVRPPAPVCSLLNEAPIFDSICRSRKIIFKF